MRNNCKTLTTIRGKVSDTKRLASSINGNPRYAVTIVDENGHDYYTATETDSGLAYCINNREFSEKYHTFYVNKRGFIGSKVGE